MIGANDTAREYAAAMYALAMEDADAAGKPEKVDEYLSRSEEIRGIVRDFPEWIDMLASPCIRIDERRKAVDEVLLVGKNNDNAGMYENFASLLKLLCDHDEAKLLDTVLSEFAKICNMRSGLVTAEVISAVGLSDNEKKALREKLAKKLGRRVELDCKVDPSIIGGVIVRADECVIDGSVKKQLADLHSTILPEN